MATRTTTDEVDKAQKAERARVVLKILKLLALANNIAADPNEATSARMKARALAFKVGIPFDYFDKEAAAHADEVAADDADDADDSRPPPHPPRAAHPGVVLSPDQATALEVILGRVRQGVRLTTLAGPAGSGKTTLLRALLAALSGWEVVCVSPTWKAAMRMEEATGRSAGTLHGLIYMGAVTDEETGEVLGFRGRAAGSVLASNPEDDFWGDDFWGDARPPRLVVVDEGSMVGSKLAADLRQALARDVLVLVVGDPFQLPPVGDKPGFDLQRPDAALTQIHRQGAGSPILAVATEIRTRHCLIDGALLQRHGGSLVRVTGTQLGDYVARCQQGGIDSVVLVATHATRVECNAAARSALGLPPMRQGPAVGERVIAMSTAPSLGVVNSDLGVVVACTPGPDLGRRCDVPTWTVEVLWDRGQKDKVTTYLPQGDWLTDGNATHRQTTRIREDAQRELEAGPGALRVAAREQGAHTVHSGFAAVALAPAYAITVHKAQGSEWEEGILVLQDTSWMRQDAWRWDYTALTRFRARVFPVELVPNVPALPGPPRPGASL